MRGVGWGLGVGGQPREPKLTMSKGIIVPSIYSL